MTMTLDGTTGITFPDSTKQDTSAEIFYTVANKTANYTLTAADKYKFILYTSSSNLTLTLPTMGVAGEGYVVAIKAAGAGNVTINRNGSDIDGAASNITLLSGESIILVSTGSTWRSLAKSSNISASIGVGQTWQDVTSSRAVNTSYLNNTGRPIVVWFEYYGSYGSTTNVDLSLFTSTDNVNWLEFQNDMVAGAGSTWNIQLIIPTNTYYKVNNGGGTGGSSFKWYELR